MDPVGKAGIEYCCQFNIKYDKAKKYSYIFRYVQKAGKRGCEILISIKLALVIMFL